MDIKTKNEIVGRLWLWSESISKTKHLLEMAFRTNIGKQDEGKLNEQEVYRNSLNEFVQQQSDYRPGIILPSHRKKFDQLHPRDFPTWLECCAIHDAFVELAIVYFCQVFNSVYSQDGEAAKSDQSFRDEHLTKILPEVFQTPKEIANFELLKNSIVNARDKVIGHSDADAYSITHASPVSIMKGPNISWRNIDFEFWYSFLDKMIIAVQNYSNQLKLIAN
jgi:hypothetical protein